MNEPTVRRWRVAASLLIALSVGTAATLSALLATAILVAPEDPSIPRPLHLGIAAITGATAILLALVGSIIEWRRSGHAVGRVMLLGGPLYAAIALVWLADVAIDASVDDDVMAVVDWAKSVVSYLGLVLVAGLLPALFPSGRLPGPRWRVLVTALLVPYAIGIVALATRPGRLPEGEGHNPFGVAGWPDALIPFVDSLALILPTVIVVAVASVVVRYRRGDRVERLQIRWLLGSVAIVAAGFVAITLELALRPASQTFLYAELIAFGGILAMPVAIGLAIFRHHLYDIDRIISRTVAWAAVSAVLAAVFVALVLVLGTLLAGIAQGDTLAVAVATLVAFALVQPVRRRVQAIVDRRFNRAAVDARRAIDAFGTGLRDEVELAQVHDRLVAAASETVQPQGVAVWIRRRRREATW